MKRIIIAIICVLLLDGNINAQDQNVSGSLRLTGTVNLNVNNSGGIVANISAVSRIKITPTQPNLVLTLPVPLSTDSGKVLYVENGSAVNSMSLNGETIAPGKLTQFIAGTLGGVLQWRPFGSGSSVAGTFRRLARIGSNGTSAENSSLIEDGAGNVVAENNFAIGGVGTAVTPATTTNTTQIATTAFVQQEVPVATSVVAGKTILGDTDVVAIAALGTCAAGNAGQIKNVSDGNKGQRTCRNTTGSTYTWVDDGPVFDVTRFGAIADDSTDSHTSITAAITAANAAGGGTVQLEKGTYRVSQYLPMLSNVKIRGRGIGVTNIRNVGSSSPNNIAFIAFGVATGQTLLNGTAGVATYPIGSPTNGSSTVTTSTAANAGNFTAGDYIIVAGDSYAADWITAITYQVLSVNAGTGAITLNEKLRRTDVSMVVKLTSYVQNIELSDLSIIGAPDIALLVKNARNVTINNIEVADSVGAAAAGTNFVNARDVWVQNSIFYRNVGLHSTIDMQVNKNVLKKGYLHIEGGCDGGIISNNIIYDPISDGIVANTQSRNLIIQGNFIFNPKTLFAGIKLDGAALVASGQTPNGKYKVVNNTIIGTTGDYGIAVGPSTDYSEVFTNTITGTYYGVLNASSNVNVGFNIYSGTTVTYSQSAGTRGTFGVDSNISTAGILQVADGTAVAPSQAFSAEATGFYRKSASVIGVSGGGTLAAHFRYNSGLTAGELGIFGAYPIVGAYTSAGTLKGSLIWNTAGETAKIGAVNSFEYSPSADASATSVFKVTGGGLLSAGSSTTPIAQLSLYNFYASIPIVVGRAHASQSANLLEMQNSGGTALTGIAKGGTLFLPNATVTATSGGTTTLNLSTGNIRTVTMPAGNTTFALSDVPVGFISIAVIQDSIGGRTITFPSTIRNGTSTLTLQPSTAANSRTQYSFQCDGTNCQLQSYQPDGAVTPTILTGSASLDFGATAAGTCDSLTITVTGAVDGDVTTIGIPAALANIDDPTQFKWYVSAANTVTVKRCNRNLMAAASDPAAATVTAKIIR